MISATLWLVACELADAGQARDDARSAEIVAQLAEKLGIAIAMITEGDPNGIEMLLAGSERVVAEVAAEKAPAARQIAKTFRRGR